ncbi:MAG: aminopeptidase, partial [Lysobacteraceae bacterium]
MHRQLLLLLALAVLCACKPPAGPGPSDAPAVASAPASAAATRIEADVRTLADDRMEGRDTGTRGYDLAAEYVARRYAEIGLAPAGDDGTFFQHVPLLKAVREREGAAFSIQRGGRTTSLAFLDQFLPGVNYNAPTHTLTAPAVFVGQAVRAPELGQDDFAGVDVRGKIAVLFSGAPKRFDTDRRAYYAHSAQKLQLLSDLGAVGVVIVGTPESEKRGSWKSSAAKWDMPGMRLRNADGTGLDTFPRLRASASISADA